MAVLYFLLLHFLSTLKTPAQATPPPPPQPVQLLQQSGFGAKICTAGIAEVQLGDTITDLVTRETTGLSPRDPGMG